jgi:hypothetical protein
MKIQNIISFGFILTLSGCGQTAEKADNKNWGDITHKISDTLSIA